MTTGTASSPGFPTTTMVTVSIPGASHPPVHDDPFLTEDEDATKDELVEVLVQELRDGPPAQVPLLAPPPELDTSLNISYSSINLNPVKPKARKKRIYLAVVWTILIWAGIAQLYKHMAPSMSAEQKKEDERWINTSKSWLDRQACRWVGICGAAHFRFIGSELDPTRIAGEHSGSEDDTHAHTDWTEGKTNPNDWTDDERVMREIPQYVLDYAPLVHLYSGEKFWPCDIEDHLFHTTPYLNYTPLQPRSNHVNLTNLADLNQYEGGRVVYLTSNDNVEERPQWLTGELNKPNPPKGSEEIEDEVEDWTDPQELLEDEDNWWEAKDGIDTGVSLAENPLELEVHTEIRRRSPQQKVVNEKLRGGKSGAPAVLIVVDKGRGIVDAFWFYFYSFNLGNVVLDVRFGNHVGDWEHNVVRFYNGKPQAVYFSEHNFGSAYSYESVEKMGKRPVVYSATGSHAMYATPGTHTYILPFGLLHDVTDRGPLWDPLRNMHSYRYNYITDKLKASNLSPNAPISWFYFAGQWGDKYYALSDERQYRFAGQYHYVSGPVGPRWKNLGRRRICQGGSNCIIRRLLGDNSRRNRRSDDDHGQITLDDIDEMKGTVDEV